MVSYGDESDCEVKGNSALWVMSYCMTIYETDDDGHPGVNSCFINERKSMNKEVDEICKVNYEYKLARCSVLKAWGLMKNTLKECIESDKYIPRIVKEGGI